MKSSNTTAQQIYLDRQTASLLDKENRSLLTDAGHSCLTCSFTPTKAGVYLSCSLKKKLVRQYNICGKHSAVKELKDAQENESVGTLE